MIIARAAYRAHRDDGIPKLNKLEMQWSPSATVPGSAFVPRSGTGDRSWKCVHLAKKSSPTT